VENRGAEQGSTDDGAAPREATIVWPAGQGVVVTSDADEIGAAPFVPPFLPAGFEPIVG
jgi:hypothetical protein